MIVLDLFQPHCLVENLSEIYKKQCKVCQENRKIKSVCNFVCLENNKLNYECKECKKKDR